MTGAKKLVAGASGFLGSHVTRQLVDRGDDVRVLIRRTRSTKAIEDLDVEYHYWAGSLNRSTTRLPGRRCSIESTYAVRVAPPLEKTSSALRMPSAGPAFTIKMCRKSSR